MFENRATGIFILLDEECRMPNPQKTSFIQKVVSNHGGCGAFSLCPSNIADGIKQGQYDFIIRHFEQEVCYKAVRSALFLVNTQILR